MALRKLGSVKDH